MGLKRCLTCEVTRNLTRDVACDASGWLRLKPLVNPFRLMAGAQRDIGRFSFGVAAA